MLRIIFFKIVPATTIFYLFLVLFKIAEYKPTIFFFAILIDLIRFVISESV